MRPFIRWRLERWNSIETPMSLAVEDYRRHVRQAVFDRMGVSLLVSDRTEPDPPWPVLSRGQADGKAYVIQQNPTALPRAYVVPRAEVIEDDPALILSRFRSSDPRSAVLMSHDPLAGLPADPRQAFTPVTWMSHDPDRPMLEVFTEAPGLLVMADTWLPGWSALVDGRPTPIYRGNYAQRVIPLEQPGHHTIILRYSPPGLVLGGFISAVSGLIWAVLWSARAAGKAVALDSQVRLVLAPIVTHSSSGSFEPLGGTAVTRLRIRRRARSLEGITVSRIRPPDDSHKERFSCQRDSCLESLTRSM